MKSAKIEHRHRHSEETKAKIAKGNKGKVFSEERRRNIGSAREVVLSPEQLVKLQEFWSRRYIPACWIMKELDISNRVYLRYLKTSCNTEQIKFLPQNLAPIVFESIVSMCLEGRPYKDIAQVLELEDRQVKNIIGKLAPFYGISALPRPRPEKTEEHKAKLSQMMSLYNKENPKKKEDNPNWKGGVTSVVESIRKSDKYKQWRSNVLCRDRFQCVHCHAKRHLQVDHIYPLILVLEDGKIVDAESAIDHEPLWNLDNGRTLCETCHRKTETYGKQRNKQRDSSNEQ
jgi:hypothetical protein